MRYSNGWNPLSSKPQIKKMKEYNAKKREANKEEAPVVSTSKPQANQIPQGGEKNKEKNWRKPYSPSVTGALLNEEGLAFSEQTYLRRTHNKYLIDKINEIREMNS
ncbi:hypothetical protein O181_114471 [Austropuccinia psidii MF-1]|uniref:Uncharacterized protein n=1 Tax=Austropuccinia psidii MF-1 TaxID=1389203 RepID=A0A9Q3K694_9BASI|nr:hypothetical protein [Austropuccinia psidii MF-1]